MELGLFGNDWALKNDAVILKRVIQTCDSLGDSPNLLQHKLFIKVHVTFK